MSILYPTALADAAQRARSRRGWGKTVGGIGLGSVLIAAFNGWNPVLLVIGGVAIAIGFAMVVSAEGHIQNAVAEAAADAAFPFDVSFDRSWIPTVQGLYRQAQAQSNRSQIPLDDSFEAIFVAHLTAQGYRRRY
uniref:hypothetical protein n=1 Tax=Paenarthrobacter ureafaciens TaxID=37931 RepID=UPI003F499589